MEFAPFYGIGNEDLKLIFPNEHDTASDVHGYEWTFRGNEWMLCEEPSLQDEEPSLQDEDQDEDQYEDEDQVEWPETGRNIIVQIVQINRFKKSGLPNKDINRQRPKDKYAEMEFWKRAKNVQMHRQSRSKNAFDASVTILQRKEEWPYDGLSLFLDGLREKTKLGTGW